VQLRDGVGLDPTKLTQEELAEQRVVAVPSPLAVQRHEEHARRFQATKPLLRPRLPEKRVAQGSTELIHYCRAPQETLNGFRQPYQRLPVQVVGYVPIVARDRQRIAPAIPRDHGGEV
jgi:hypothetical protein